MASIINSSQSTKVKLIACIILITLPLLFFASYFARDYYNLHQLFTQSGLWTLFLIQSLSFGCGLYLFLNYKSQVSIKQYVHSNPFPMLVTTLDYKILYANAEFYAFFPGTQGHLNDIISYLYSPQEQSIFENYLTILSQNDYIKSELFKFKTPGHPACIYSVHVKRKSGMIYWSFIPAPDYEKKILFNETLFHRDLDTKYLFNTAPAGNVILNNQGLIEGYNATFKKLFAGNEDLKLGSHFAALLSDACLTKLQSDLIAKLNKQPTHTAIELEFNSGAVAIAYFSKLNFPNTCNGSNHSGFYLQLFDNQEQRNLQSRLAHSHKLQALGQLAGGIAHDFNNLLTAMIGFCDLLLMRLSPGDQSFTDIMQIKQNANRATNLIRQLLAFSRQQTLQPSVLDISEVLADLSILLQRLIGSKIDLKITYDRAADFIRVDRGQFEQVIINLVVNARDAIKQEGNIRIATKLVIFEQSTVFDHEEIPPGRYIQIEVIDDGHGISKENLERIFDPFFSTKHLGDGTGLGLSTVYGIVKQTGGYINAESTVGLGTKFTILLPQYQKSKTASPLSSHPSPKADIEFHDLTGHGHILIAEDEDAVRLFTVRALTDKGYKVNQAQNGLEALEYLKTLKAQGLPAPDLLITDVVMPRMDGPTLVKEAHQLFPNLKILYVSGYAEDAFRDMISIEEKNRFLAKPFSLKILAARVKACLDGQHP